MIDVLNAVDKLYIYQLMSKLQLPVSVIFDSQIKMHTGTENKYISLAKKFKDHLGEEHLQNGAINQRKSGKTIHGNKMDRKKLSCSGKCCC